MGPRSPLFVVVAFLAIGFAVFASVNSNRRDSVPAPPPPPVRPDPKPAVPAPVAAPAVQNKPPPVPPLSPGDKVRLTHTWIAATSWVMSRRVNELIDAEDAIGLARLIELGHAARVPKDAVGRMIVGRPWLDSFEQVEFRVEYSSDRELVGETVVVPRKVIRRYNGELLEVAPSEPDRNRGHETLEEVRDRLPKEAPAMSPENPQKPTRKAPSLEELAAQAERKLALAERYHRNGFNEDALLLVKEILSLYPETPSASKAADLQKKITGSR